ncbi:MAG: hypothetical protein GXO25_07795 [Euryarchaeota archaeon]|nr:hypothetical protein [Euryarchaeota archaeon]
MKVGLKFNDKRLEYRVSCELSRRGIPHEIINHTIDGYTVVLSDSPGWGVEVNDPVEGARRAVSYIYNKPRFTKIIVGIDPGPRPGLAVVGDGFIVEEIQLTRVDETPEVVQEIRRGYLPERIIVRIGNGDVVNRNRIVNSLLSDFTVEIVDEKNTSDTITNRNVEAAKHIAFTRGRPVMEPLNTVIREGYLREIQRRSRIESNGMITIPRELARKVAVGELTLKEAIGLVQENEA